MDSEDETAIKYFDKLCCNLTEKILCCLSAKELLRCRKVCKDWKTLIDSYPFKLNHFHASKVMALTVLYSIADAKPPALTHVIRSPLSWRFASVNGIFCSVWLESMVVFNSFSRETREFEVPPKHWVSDLREQCGCDPNVRFNTHQRHRVSAFGFDPRSNDYKFMLAVFTTRNKVFVQIFSLRNQSWRGLAIDFTFWSKTQLVIGDGYLDGKFYWFAKECRKIKADSYGPAVVAFDFSNENFELMPLSGDLAKAKDAVVVTTRGCLELITILGTTKHRCCEIWGMDKNLLWSRKLRLSLIKVPEITVPIRFTNDGRIVFESRANNKDKPTMLDQNLDKLNCHPRIANGYKEIMIVNPTTLTCHRYGHRFKDISLFSSGENLLSINPNGF